MHAIVEDYRQRRSEEKLLIRRKKREQERREREEIEMYRNRNDAQKFFRDVSVLQKASSSDCRAAGTKKLIW